MKKLTALLLTILLLVPCAALAYGAELLTPTPTSDLADLVLKPSQDEVKVYASPNYKANIVGYIIVGGRQEVQVLSLSGDWCYVQFTSIYGDTLGWIPRSFFAASTTPTPRPTATPTPAPVTGQCYVDNLATGGRLNLRSQPSITAVSLGKYYTGVPVTRTGLTRNGFAQVIIGNVMGWMDERYLSVNPYLYLTETPQTFVVNRGSGANLRQGPGTGHGKLGWYAHGTPVTVLGVRQDGWYHVMVQGQNGYMSDSLLQDQYPWQYGTDSDAPAHSSGITGAGTMYVLGRTSTEGVHLREKAAATARSLGRYYTGATVRIISYTRTGWAYVSIGGLEGYMATSSLTATAPAQKGLGHIISNPYGTGLNLRTAATSASSIIRLYPNYTYVTVLGRVDDDWCYVLVDGQEGYMIGTRLIQMGGY